MNLVFSFWNIPPEQYLTSDLAESWEVTAEGVTFYLRHGIMWTGREDVMESRELTADDIVFHLERLRNRPGYASWYSFIDSVTAPDRYTVCVDFTGYNAAWAQYLGWYVGTGIIPPEVVGAGAENWFNAVGTGPFIMTGYVKGSYVVYEKNPDYWGTTTINGKEYQIPFIDKLFYPVIPDESTQVAALRTAKLDMWPRVPLRYEASLIQTCPELVQDKYLTGRVDNLKLKACTESDCFYKREVRRAVMIGTDLEAIRNAIYIEGELHCMPMGRGTPEYTPFEELPESTKELFDYDPVEAQQMLADAGFPNGFECEMILSSQYIDLGSMLQEMWAKIGVTLQLTVLESAAVTARSAAADYDVCPNLHTDVNPFQVLGILGKGDRPASSIKDARYDEMYNEAIAITDPAERTAKLKELALYFEDNVMVLGICNPYNISAYWPWVKNYYGELDCGFHNAMPMISTLWIDQDMKAELGYK